MPCFAKGPHGNLAGGQVQNEQLQNFRPLLSPLSHNAALPSGISQKLTWAETLEGYSKHFILWAGN